jgi:hypothetical protein
MAIYALKTTGDDPRYPSAVVEADVCRRFARVTVFVRGGRDWYEIPAERVAEIRRFSNRIDAELWLAGQPLAPGASPAGGGRRASPPADLPQLAPGPGRAPSRKLTPVPLAAVLDLSKERVAVSPTGDRVEEVVVRVTPPPAPAAAPAAGEGGGEGGGRP